MNRTLAMVALASGLAASPVAADTFVIDPTTRTPRSRSATW